MLQPGSVKALPATAGDAAHEFGCAVGVPALQPFAEVGMETLWGLAPRDQSVHGPWLIFLALGLSFCVRVKENPDPIP